MLQESGKRRRWQGALLATALLAMLGACVEPKPGKIPHNQRDDMRASGVLTGDQGAWMIYRSDQTVGGEPVGEVAPGEEPKTEPGGLPPVTDSL